MAFSPIDSFITSIKGDLARPYNFDVQIPFIEKLAPKYGGTIKDLTFRCESAQLPSRTLQTTQRKIYSISEQHPVATSYNTFDATFIVSDDMMEKKFFDEWMEYINPTKTFNVAYKDDYCGDLIVSQYDNIGNIQYSIMLIDAFPIVVNQLDLNWGNVSSTHKLSVVFAYYYWIDIIKAAQGSIVTDELVDTANKYYSMESIHDLIDKNMQLSKPSAGAAPQQTSNKKHKKVGRKQGTGTNQQQFQVDVYQMQRDGVQWAQGGAP
jgi:hypothetical protein